MRTYGERAISIALLIAASCLPALKPVFADDTAYETAADMNAADILPGELLSGAHHTVEDRVRNDGYLNYYSISSEYGRFEAASTAMLRVRVREINALAQLDELSRTEIFIKAAADAGIGQLKSIQQFVKRPVQTVVGIPRGIGRLFIRYARRAGDAVGTAKEFVDDDDADQIDEDRADDANLAVDLSERYFGVSDAERAWARELGTDPYSTNETLRAAIKQVAWADRLGRFGIRFAGIPAIPGAEIIGQVNEAVWSKDPRELQALNRTILAGTGADEELIDRYLASKRYSPTQQSVLTAAIAELADAGGRGGILIQALNARTDTEARFFVRSVTMLAWYHINQSPIVTVVTDTAIPAGITDDGKLVILFATDHVYWTDEVAETAAIFNTALAAYASADPREVWFLGTTSERCDREAAALGWKVHREVARMLLDDSDGLQIPET